MITIYHNPRCSKSRATVALIEEQGITPEIVEYLEQTPDAQTLKNITKLLGCSIGDIIRKGEDIYKELGIESQNLSENELIDVVVSNPRLLERPIVINGNRAAVGRPPENVLAIL